MHIPRHHPSSGSDSARATPPGFAFVPVPTRADAALIQAASLPRLVTVCAPPGYGKTLLLARLHETLVRRGRRCLWVALDDRDSDLSSLLHLVQSAWLSDRRAADEPATDALPHRDARLDAVIAQLCRSRADTVLFIDNLGFCHDPQLEAFLARLVFAGPAALHLVLSSTGAIPLDIARARFELGAMELRAAHLVLDRVGTARLLSNAGVAPLSAADIDRIQAQTEGWPAAVRLLQVLMSHAAQGLDATLKGEPHDVLAHFGGDQRDIAEVLTRRVLVGFDPAVVNFMLETALVREFNAELAVRMTGRKEAHAWLALLVQRNVLIFPLDRDRRWFRFHTLLRDFLLAEARQVLSTKRRTELLTRAALWHAEQGDDTTALDVALDAALIPTALDLIDRVARAVAGDQGRMALFIRWFDRLLACGAVPSPEAHGWYVWALCHTLQYERARLALARLDQRVGDGARSSVDMLARLGFLRIFISLYLDRLDEAGDAARAWLASQAPRDALSESSALAIVALSAFDGGDMCAATSSLQRADAAMARAGSRWGQTWIAIIRACIETQQARPDLADALLVAARPDAVEALGADAGVVATLDFVHARVLLDLGRRDQARGVAQRGLACAVDQGLMLTAEQGLLACAALWASDDKAPDGPSADAINAVARSYPPRLHALLSAARVRRLLELGHLGEAMGLARDIRLCDRSVASERTGPRWERGEWLAAQIDILVARGEADEAHTLIEAQLRRAAEHQRHRDRVELWLAAAELHHCAGRPGKAAHVLSLAIAEAAAGRLMHPFQRRPVLLRAILAAAAAASSREVGLAQTRASALLDRLDAWLKLSEHGARSIGAPPPPGAELPTARELQLLGLLDQGLSNQQVADRLLLSLTTVKWHLHNLYAKLGVGSRSAALAKARANRQLPEHDKLRGCAR
jgi:LuxR family maltose regulon positive regulatory protein